MCVNCGGNHSSAYKNCKHYKANIKGIFDHEVQKTNSQLITNKQKTLQEQQNSQNLQLQNLQNKQHNITNMEETFKELKTKIKDLTETNKTIIEEQNEHKKLLTDKTKLFKIMAKDIDELAEELNKQKQIKNQIIEEKEIKELKEEIRKIKIENKRLNHEITTLQNNQQQNKTPLTEKQQQNKTLKTNNTPQNNNKNNKQSEKYILQQTEDLEGHINNTIAQIIKNITIPLITTTIINHQTIKSPKVLERRIIETLTILLQENNEIPINIDDIKINTYESESTSSTTEEETNIEHSTNK